MYGTLTTRQPPGRSTAPRLGEHGGRVREVLDDVEHHDGVHAGVAEREVPGVAAQQGEPRVGRPGVSDVPLVPLDPDDPRRGIAPPLQRGRPVAEGAAHVEHPAGPPGSHRRARPHRPTYDRRRGRVGPSRIEPFS